MAHQDKTMQTLTVEELATSNAFEIAAHGCPGAQRTRRPDVLTGSPE